MEKKLADKLEDLIKTKVSDDVQLNAFIKANEEYQKLLQEGLTTKRGFNLMTTEEIYSPILNRTNTQTL